MFLNGFPSLRRPPRPESAHVSNRFDPSPCTLGKPLAINLTAPCLSVPVAAGVPVCPPAALQSGVGLLCGLLQQWGQVRAGTVALAGWLLGEGDADDASSPVRNPRPLTLGAGIQHAPRQIPSKPPLKREFKAKALIIHTRRRPPFCTAATEGNC